MTTWNRNISWDGSKLVVSITGANPPNRTDTATDITTLPADRPATIIYHASPPNAIQLTGLIPDQAGGSNPTYPALPDYALNPPGSLLTITDTDAEPSYWYFVGAKVLIDGQWVQHQTPDPQIHNQ